MEGEDGQQYPYTSSWQVVNFQGSQGRNQPKVVKAGSTGKAVVCPVCKNLLDLETWSKDMLVQHMKVHNMHMTGEWRRACQACIDRGDSFTRVAPEHLLSHIQSAHKANGPTPQQVPAKDAVAALAPLPVQPEPAIAPALDAWKFIKGHGEHWVVCPSPHPPIMNFSMKAKNIVKHLAKVHPRSDVYLGFKKLLCQGCKAAVPPEQLVNHIACQPTTADETSMKRKVTSTGTSPGAKGARPCGYSFLAAHKSQVRRSRGKSVKCHVNGCDKAFLKANLGDHRRLVHGFAKLQCNVVPNCTHQFLSVSSLAQHIKGKHPK